MLRFAAVLVTLAIAQPLFAQTPSSPRATARFGALRQAGDPYRKLFTTPPAMKPAAAEAAPKKKVVCGLTMIEGDSSIDPNMAKAFPKQDGAAHTIRAIDPPTCKP